MTRIKRPIAARRRNRAAVVLPDRLRRRSPDDASEKDFCDAFGGVFDTLFAADADGPTEDQWKDVQDAVAELEDTGTPKDISDDERNGFEVFTEAVADADYDDIKDSNGDELPGVDKDDQADGEAFIAYGTKTCPDALGIPTDLPTDIPTQ